MGKAPFWGLNDKGQSPNEGPLYAPDPWDTFFINNDQIPGECWVEAKDIAELEVEAKKGKNSSGVKLSILGYKPGNFDVVCRIVTPDQWSAFQDVRNKYWAGPSKAMKPPQATVSVKHPDLNSLNIYKAVIVGFMPAEKSDVEGAKHFRIRFHEEVKKRASKTVNAAGALPPEDERQPPSAGLNLPSEDPSENPQNTSLEGPKLTANPGAL